MNEPAVRRLVAGLDASPLGLAALDLAARLAARLPAAATALFVEDINLVRLAAHPQASVVSLAFGRRQRPDDALIGAALDLQAAAARRALAEAERRHGTALAFQQRRGQVAGELLAAAAGADLLLLGWSGRPGGARRLGTTAAAVAAGAGQPVLLLRQELGPDTPVHLWAGGSPLAGRARLLAAELVRALGGEVLTAEAGATPPDGVLVIPAGEIDDIERIACSLLLVR